MLTVFTLSLLLAGCGGIGTCDISCVTDDGAQEIGPYYDETEGSCEDEREKAQEGLANWNGVCTADFTPY